MIDYDLGMSKRQRKMLKLAEIEQDMGVSRWTLYAWLKEGKIRGIKLPSGHYRVPREELEKLKREIPTPQGASSKHA